MFGKSPRFLWLFVLAALVVVDRPAAAQFGISGGLTAPVVLPAPRLGYGGYGRYGGRRGYGVYGFGTQWMQNPYQGYLNGAASLTTANAQYQQTIQQAKLTREEARRSALQTRRATLEEREYERSLLPDPEQIRQKQMMKSLERSRNNPPSTDIWSATALNDLLRAIQTAQTRGTSGSDVPLSPEVLKHINTTTGKSYGGVGLLRDGGKLTWPSVLRQSMFDAPRKRMDELLPQAVKQARAGAVNADTLNDINATLKDLQRIIDAGAAEELTPTQYIAAARYLRELKESARVLQQDDVAKYFQPEWTPRARRWRNWFSK